MGEAKLTVSLGPCPSRACRTDRSHERRAPCTRPVSRLRPRRRSRPRGPRVRRFPRRGGPALVADAAGRPPRLRRLALQRRCRRSPARPALISLDGWSRTACCRGRSRPAARASRCGPPSRPSATAAAPRDPRRSPATRGQPDWLEDFALFCALKRAHGEVQWTRWPARSAIASRRRWQDARADAGRGHRASSRFEQLRFARDWRALRALRARAGRRPHRRHADLRRPRQRRRLAAPRAVPPRRARRADGGRRRAARLLQRHRPALGQPALPLGPRCARPGTHWWIERFRATLAPSTPSASTTSSASPATGRSRPRAHRGQRALGRGPGRALLRARCARRWASCRSSPRTWAS